MCPPNPNIFNLNHCPHRSELCVDLVNFTELKATIYC